MQKIIAENKKHVRAVIRRLTGQENEDLEQEVYLKVWQNLPAYREEGKFKQWICMITANICRDRFRSKGYKIINREIDDEAVAETPSEEKPVEEVLDARQRQKLILKAVDELPKHYRDVIILYEFEDYPLEKIATGLKIPLGTIKSRLHNARNILKEKLSFLQGDQQ
jgi:RNA polymerase sigma-70 factor (ECF subfamily)